MSFTKNRIHTKKRKSPFIVCKEGDKGEGVKYLPFPHNKILRKGMKVGRFKYDEYYDVSGLTNSQKEKYKEEKEKEFPTHYFDLLDDKKTLAKINNKNLINKINHKCSKEANCEINMNGWCIAKRNIRPGEFLSISYGNTQFGRQLNKKNEIEKTELKKIKEKGLIRDSKGRFKKHSKVLNENLKKNIEYQKL